jgi:hypothetical protein
MSQATWGNCRLPFMNSTTLLLLMNLSSASLSSGDSPNCAGAAMGSAWPRMAVAVRLTQQNCMQPRMKTSGMGCED